MNNKIASENIHETIQQAMEYVKHSNIKGQFMNYSELLDYLRSIMKSNKKTLVNEKFGINEEIEVLTAKQIIFDTSVNDNLLHRQKTFTYINRRCVGLNCNLTFTMLSKSFSGTNSIVLSDKTEEAKQRLEFWGLLGGFVNDKYFNNGIVYITLISSLEPIAYTLQIVI